jgi:hypothetical protein
VANKLTRAQITALRWINDFPHTRARWMRNGKDAYGPPETWDQYELSGSQGSLRISALDQEAIRPFVEPAPWDEMKRL